MEFKEQYLNVVNERWGHSSRGRAKLEHMLSGQLISSKPSHTLPSGKAADLLCSHPPNPMHWFCGNWLSQLKVSHTHCCHCLPFSLCHCHGVVECLHACCCCYHCSHAAAGIVQYLYAATTVVHCYTCCRRCYCFSV